MIAHDDLAGDELAAVPDSGSEAAPIEPASTWRDALLARLHPADHRVSDEEIFALLNDAGDGHTAAERCAQSGVTVPMYCVWKSKYRQLSLDELREARRREQRRRYLTIGLMLLVATLSAGAIVGGLSWAMLSAFTRSIESPSTMAAAVPGVEPERRAVVEAPQPVAEPAPQHVAKPAAKNVAPPPSARPSPDAIAETGYRIQVTAADNEEQGRAMVAALAAAGYPAYMTQAVVANRNVFRVRVGPFETQPEAEKVAAQLRGAGYAGAWIAR